MVTKLNEGKVNSFEKELEARLWEIDKDLHREIIKSNRRNEKDRVEKLGMISDLITQIVLKI